MLLKYAHACAGRLHSRLFKRVIGTVVEDVEERNQDEDPQAKKQQSTQHWCLSLCKGFTTHLALRCGERCFTQCC